MPSKDIYRAYDSFSSNRCIIISVYQEHLVDIELEGRGTRDPWSSLLCMRMDTCAGAALIVPRGWLGTADPQT